MKSIGEILCEMHCLKQCQLEQALALKEQKGETRPLEQILIDHGYITKIHLQMALKIQEKTKKEPTTKTRYLESQA